MWLVEMVLYTARFCMSTRPALQVCWGIVMDGLASRWFSTITYAVCVKAEGLNAGERDVQLTLLS